MEVQPAWQLNPMLIRYKENEPEDYFISLGKIVKLLPLSFTTSFKVMMTLILLLELNSSYCFYLKSPTDFTIG